MSKYCLFLIVIYYLTGGNNSMSRFCKFGKLHVTKGNVDKLLGMRSDISQMFRMMVFSVQYTQLIHATMIGLQHCKI